MYEVTERDETAECESSVSVRRAIAEALAVAAQVDLSWITPPPTNDGWTLAPDACRFITSLVSKLNPRHILEFGSGLSTRVLARACASLPHSSFLSSLDHDPEFGGAAAQQYFAQAEPRCHVRMQIAPIVSRDHGGKTLPSYLIQPEHFATQEPVDLVIVDGPPAMLGGREATLYQVMDFARPGTLVLLDDAMRKAEQSALAHWQDNYGHKIEVLQLDGFVRGLAAVIVFQPVCSTELWTHRLRLTRREMQRLIRPEDVCIIVGNDWWREELGDQFKKLPFFEHQGQYWGPPADDTTAIRDLNRLRRDGARFLVFGWPTFWWLEHYQDLNKHLQTNFNKVADNDRLIVFDLSEKAAADGRAIDRVDAGGKI